MAQNFRAGQQFGVAEYLNTRAESIYHSSKYEPLGKPHVRGHIMPPHLREDSKSFAGFGKKIKRDDDAKGIIYPAFMVESEDAKEMYKKTHAEWEPGESASRKYKWPTKITEDPHFRFGLADLSEVGLKIKGAKGAMNMEYNDGAAYPLTHIVDKTNEDFRYVATDQLGTTRNLLQARELFIRAKQDSSMRAKSTKN